MINVKLDMKRLIKLLEKEFPNTYVVVEQQICKRPEFNENKETFKAYVAHHYIFLYSGRYASPWTREFDTVKDLTAHVKEAIYNYRIAQSKLIKQEDNLPPEDSTT